MATPETLPRELIEQLNEIVGEREGLVIAYVPLELIYTADVPVDADRVDELRREIKAEQEKTGRRTGQLEPVLLGHVVDLSELPVMDGFHRTIGSKRDNELELLGTIRPYTTWDEIIKHRILNAQEHDSVKFARTVSWIHQAWDMTEWSKNRNITTIQAFNLGADEKLTGKKLGLSPEEVEEIREWVNDKSSQWKTSISTILDNLGIARLADPKLVKATRDKKSQKTLTTISPRHLNAIAKGLPRDYERQGLIADFAVENNLSVPQTAKAVARIADTESFDEAKEALEDPVWKKKTTAKPPKRKTNIIKFKENVRLAENLMITELDICRMAIDTVALSGKYLPTHKDVERPPIAFLPKEVPEQAKEFDWSVKKVNELKRLLADAHEPAVTAACGKMGLFEDQAETVARATAQRILKDIKTGALRYTGITTQKQFNSLFANCLKDEVRAYKARTSPTGRSPVVITNNSRRLVLDEVSFTNLIASTDEKENRRMLTLSTVFGLPSFVIAQVIDVGDEIKVRGSLIKLAQQAKLITSK